jgi:hypothetical protein
MNTLEDQLIRCNFKTFDEIRYVAGIYEGYRLAENDIEETSKKILGKPF